MRYGDSHARCRSQKAADAQVRRWSIVADRLRGGKPAEIAIEQADRIELVVTSDREGTRTVDTSSLLDRATGPSRLTQWVRSDHAVAGALRNPSRASIWPRVTVLVV